MKNTKFYVCPDCGNLITAGKSAEVCCCGRKLAPLELKKAGEDEKLNTELIENDYYISSDHEMKKEHYITFVALMTGDAIVMKKQYPEWDLQVRIPRIAHGRLIWHCSRDGMFYQYL